MTQENEAPRGGRGRGRGQPRPQQQGAAAAAVEGVIPDRRRQRRRGPREPRANEARDADAPAAAADGHHQQQHDGPRARGRGYGRARGGQPDPQPQEQPRGRGGGRGRAIARGGPRPKVDEYGNPIGGGGRGRGAKNTESFVPSHDPPAMRIVVDPHPTQCQIRLTTLDVTLHPCVFARPGDETIYARLVSEIEACTIPQNRMLKSWHGDSHWIADDHTGWKKQVPTFNHVIERLAAYFTTVSRGAFKINATRLNWYKGAEEWKPFHHDAAAVKPEIAKIQNFTVAVSFGVTREAAFEDVASRRILSFVVPDGSIYTFARDINVTWKHGIIQPKPGTFQHEQAQGGRISIIAWGWLDQDEC